VFENVPVYTQSRFVPYGAFVKEAGPGLGISASVTFPFYKDPQALWGFKLNLDLFHFNSKYQSLGTEYYDELVLSFPKKVYDLDTEMNFTRMYLNITHVFPIVRSWRLAMEFSSRMAYFTSAQGNVLIIPIIEDDCSKIRDRIYSSERASKKDIDELKSVCKTIDISRWDYEFRANCFANVKISLYDVYFKIGYLSSQFCGGFSGYHTNVLWYMEFFSIGYSYTF
jgi:hypothetical protein